jgi:hypothetical protein
MWHRSVDRKLPLCSLTYWPMVDEEPLHCSVMKSPWVLAIAAIVSIAPLCKSAIADPTNFDSSHCKSAFAARDYASAAKYCRAEAQATLKKVSGQHLQGDQKAYILGIAAIQMELLSAAQSRTDAAEAPQTLNEAKRLIHTAINSCQSSKCRDAMQHTANRIESEGTTNESNSS